LCSTKLGKREPENKNKLESVVEWEPVDGIDGTFKYSQEGENHPVREPLSIICFTNTEESFKRVVSRNDETSKIGKKLSTDVEEDEEEVGSNKTQESIHFGDRCLLLQIVQDWILRKLLINVGNVALSLVLERRHIELLMDRHE